MNGRSWWLWVVALGVGLATGCASTPQLDNPLLVRPGFAPVDNSILIPGQPTPEGYAEIYDRVIDALDDYFVIKPTSRYSGTVETYPRVAPGWEQPWKPSTPDSRERWLASTQSMRHYAVVKIWASEQGGFNVYVEVYKELEDLAQPITARAGRTIFRDAATVDRRGELTTGAAPSEPTWIPAGKAPHRDFAFEQEILQKIQRPGTHK